MAVDEKVKPVEDIHGGGTATDKQSKRKAAKEAKLAEKEAKKAAKDAAKGGHGSKGIMGRIVPILLFVLIVGGGAAVLWYNLFNFRDKYFVPVVEKIPIVNNLLPPKTGSEADPNASLSRDELIKKVSDLEAQLATRQDEVTALTDKNKLYADQIANLKVFEDAQVKFKADKEVFDKMIANQDPTAYSAFYEQIAPETAKQVYSQVVATAAQSKEFKKYIDTYQAMDETAAAQMLEQLVPSDTDLVVLILKNIDSKKSASILAAMTPDKAAVLTKQLKPVTTTPTPAPSATQTP